MACGHARGSTVGSVNSKRAPPLRRVAAMHVASVRSNDRAADRQPEPDAGDAAFAVPR